MDIRTLYLVVGIVYVAVPFTLFLAIRKTSSDRQTAIWNLAWLSMGLGAILVGLRDVVPDWMSFLLAHFGFAVAYFCRAAVLVMERSGVAEPIPRAAVLRYGLVAVAYLFVFCVMVYSEVPVAYRMTFVNLAHLYFFLEFAVQAYRLSRLTGRSGALLLAVMGLMIGFGFLIRALALIADVGAGQDAFYPSIDQSVILLLALIGFVIGHFGLFQLRMERLAFQKQRVMDQLEDAEQTNSRLRKVLEARNDNLKRVSVMTNASSVGMLAGSLTHELSQPLTSIRLNLAFVERALRDQPQFHAAHDALREVTHESERLYGVVQRLRSLFQRGTADYEKVHLVNVVSAVASIIEPSCREAGIRLQLSLNKDLVVMGDIMQLQTLVLNLLGNAMQAIRSTKPQGTIWLSLERRGNSAVCTVSDDGPGFPANFNLEDPEIFFSSKPEGSGVGLWLSRLIVKIHSGTLSCSNNSPTQGARIEVVLPLSDSP